MPPTPIHEAPDAKVLLELRDIKKAFFGVQVLKGVSLRVIDARVVGLVGENGAGKSTLMNILGGNLRADAGEMLLNGERYQPKHPMGAAASGIAFVHQELNLFPNLSIAENIFLAAFPRRFSPFIARRPLRERTAELLRDVGLSLPPDTLVEGLTAGQRQLVEIAKALSFSPKLVILDEPTTSLSIREIDNLFALMQRLRGRGVAMIYISHILGDVLRLCDDVVVLRDGEVVGEGPRATFTSERMISLMVGRELTSIYPSRSRDGSQIGPASPAVPGPGGIQTGREIVQLELRNVSQPRVVRDISFQLHAGEVLGLSGLMGAGRSELARIIFGLDPYATGEILLEDKPLPRGGPRGRIRNGIALVTEDRRGEGLCMEGSVVENMALVSLRRHARGPLQLLDRSWRAAVRTMRESVRLGASARDEHPVRTLSGGNQQKVVLGKWLLGEPRVFILDEPTRGIDVGARFEIYQLIHQLADRGAGVLVISSEMEELVGICGRILVMNQGQIRGEFRAGEFNREAMLRAALLEGSRAAPPGSTLP